MKPAVHSGGDLSDRVDATPFITVSLVTFNGTKWLRGCLHSLAQQDIQDFELLVLDNGSLDGTPKELRKLASGDPRMVVVESKKNIGYAAGHNILIRRARGEFVVLLNQDVELETGFLRMAVTAFYGRPEVAAVQGRIRRLAASGERTNLLDTTGLIMHRDRRVVSRAQGEVDGSAHAIAGPVWGADGPVPVYRKSALIDAREPRTAGGWEVLDEDFFAYKEDVDLAWRLRLLGWSTWYAPAALAWHARGAGGPPAVGWLGIIRRNRGTPGWIRALSWRNQRLLQLKCDSIRSVVEDLPWILRREFLAILYIIIADPARLPAIAGLLRLAPGAMRKRRYLLSRIATDHGARTA